MDEFKFFKNFKERGEWVEALFIAAALRLQSPKALGRLLALRRSPVSTSTTAKPGPYSARISSEPLSFRQEPDPERSRRGRRSGGTCCFWPCEGS